MVRVNIINPKKLSDQHLIAEYNEILMLVAYIKNHPEIVGIPETYKLGRGHMIFFKDKLNYLKKRHELLKEEMRSRDFQTNKTIDLNIFEKENKKDWKPKQEDFEIIEKRIMEKIKLKPNYYRYYRENKGIEFFSGLLKSRR